MDFETLTDAQLLRGVAQLRADERAHTAVLIAHLVEVERRQLFAQAGHASMFAYLHRGLGYPEDAAAKRARVARLAAEHPAVLLRLADGRLHLSGAVLLAPHLTRDNARDVLDAADHKSKREIEALAADLRLAAERATAAARPPAPAAPRTASLPLPAGPSRGGGAEGAHDRPTRSNSAPPPSPARREVRRALGGGASRLAFDASDATVGQLEELRALLSHRVPSGDLDRCLAIALPLALAELRKARFGSPEPRRAAAASGKRTRHIPAAVRRSVYDRDGGRCAYVAPDGTRCGETRFLELHHAGVPFSLGGEHTVENLQSYCRAHNQWAARDLPGARRRGT